MRVGPPGLDSFTRTVYKYEMIDDPNDRAEKVEKGGKVGKPSLASTARLTCMRSSSSWYKPKHWI